MTSTRRNGRRSPVNSKVFPSLVVNVPPRPRPSAACSQPSRVVERDVVDRREYGPRRQAVLRRIAHLDDHALVDRPSGAAQSDRGGGGLGDRGAQSLATVAHARRSPVPVAEPPHHDLGHDRGPAGGEPVPLAGRINGRAVDEQAAVESPRAPGWVVELRPHPRHRAQRDERQRRDGRSGPPCRAGPCRPTGQPPSHDRQHDQGEEIRQWDPRKSTMNHQRPDNRQHGAEPRQNPHRPHAAGTLRGVRDGSVTAARRSRHDRRGAVQTWGLRPQTPSPSCAGSM